jgi:Ca2+-binding RTX toxin-like protein
MATAGMAVVMLALAGVALAAVLTCTGGRCDGTNDPDQITGSALRDRIFALAGNDQVFARAGHDEMNGGPGDDEMGGQEGNDILRGQEGNESAPGGTFPGAPPLTELMSGDLGNDILYGGPGQDGMRGDEGTDELYGGRNKDFIDAVNNESPGTGDAPDLVDCGNGFDTAWVYPNDRVRANCEDVTDMSTPGPMAATGTD